MPKINKDTDLSELNSYISGLTKIKGTITIEHPVRTYGRVKLNNKVTIGKYSFVNEGTTVFRGATIGRYCSIGKNCQISTFDHPIKWLSSSPVFYNLGMHFPGYAEEVKKQIRPVRPSGATIGHDVWVGSNVIIPNGINIGTGAVLAGGAFISKDVPPYAIVGGVPAKIIKYRFTDEQIEALLTSKWWELPLSVTSLFDFDDIEKVIEQLNSYRESSN